MEQRYSLSQPDLFTLFEGDRTWRGADQEWYSDEWQRKAGCGPTAAAMVAFYLAETRSECLALYPSRSQRRKDILSLMGELWTHVTPGRMGVNTLSRFVRGFQSFLSEREVSIPLRTLDVPRFRIARPTASQCAAFLRTALAADSPVAWLNLHHGEVAELDSWHWVVITSMEQRSDGALLCTILDAGREFTVDFRLWFQTTRAGGGLVAPGRS